MGRGYASGDDQLRRNRLGEFGLASAVDCAVALALQDVMSSLAGQSSVIVRLGPEQPRNGPSAAAARVGPVRNRCEEAAHATENKATALNSHA